MKIMSIFNLIFYIGLVFFIYLIPHDTMDSYILKTVVFLSMILVFILLLSFYVIIFFNKKYKNIKKFIYSHIVCMICGFLTFICFGHLIFEKTNSISLLILILIILFVLSIFLQYKISVIMFNKQYKLIEEVFMFLKIADILEETPLIKSIQKIDNMFLVFCFFVGFAENIYFYITVIIILSILSAKHSKIIKNEFLNNELISSKEAYLSIFCYYFFLLLSIVWFVFIPNLSVILIVSMSELLIKIYIHRIAKNIYEEENYDVEN